ncbi:MAG TPA: hypothetical protein V6C52_14630 [Coleofasciculaceae cyanobacterium]|jgi:hypothetical protein
MNPIRPIRFGEATYVLTPHEYSVGGHPEAANALVEYLDKERGLRSQFTKWDIHQFVLNGKDLVTIEKARDDFEKSVDLLRSHIFTGRDHGDWEGKNPSRDLPHKWQLPDYLRHIQASAEKARTTTINILKASRVWRTPLCDNAYWPLSNLQAPLFKKNLLPKAKASAMMASIFAPWLSQPKH